MTLLAKCLDTLYIQPQLTRVQVWISCTVS